MLTANDLFCLATAKGVDLSHVGGTASDTQGDAAPRRLSRDEREYREKNHLGMEVLETVKGNGTRVYRRPAYQHTDLGHAAAGVGEVQWAASRFHIAGEERYYWRPLWWSLDFHVRKMARREGWAPRVRGVDGEPRHYLSELAQLVLDADAPTNRQYFAAAPGLYAIVMQVEQVTWDKILCDRYRSLLQIYESWISTARSQVQRNLTGDDFVIEDES
jgi:hypothetical protein